MALKGFGAPGALQKGESCGTCSPIPLRCISNAGRLQFHTGAGIRFLSRQVFKGIGFEENSRYVVVCATPKSESPSEALDRRLRESKRVEERVIKIHATEDFEEEVEKAGSNLVVLEVNSDLVCESGLDEEPELHWRRDRKEHEKELWEKCKAVKHVFQRTARECPDIRFLSLTVDTLDSSKLCDKLNISVLPTLQFYKKGRLLWEHKGALHMQQDLGEGVLFYGNTAAGGEKATQHVQELHSREDLEKFLGDTQQNNTLAVIDISVTSASPCVRMFPAVVALAKNFQGYAAFARLLGDESPETEDIMRKLGIIDVPTYLFFRNGKLVDKHVGSSRADLIGHILELQSIQGIPPPPPGGNESKQQMRKKEVSNV